MIGFRSTCNELVTARLRYRNDECRDHNPPLIDRALLARRIAMTVVASSALKVLVIPRSRPLAFPPTLTFEVEDDNDDFWTFRRRTHRIILWCESTQCPRCDRWRRPHAAVRNHPIFDQRDQKIDRTGALKSSVKTTRCVANLRRVPAASPGVFPCSRGAPFLRCRYRRSGR